MKTNRQLKFFKVKKSPKKQQEKEIKIWKDFVNSKRSNFNWRTNFVLYFSVIWFEIFFIFKRIAGFLFKVIISYLCVSFPFWTSFYIFFVCFSYEKDIEEEEEGCLLHNLLIQQKRKREGGPSSKEKSFHRIFSVVGYLVSQLYFRAYRECELFHFFPFF